MSKGKKPPKKPKPGRKRLGPDVIRGPKNGTISFGYWLVAAIDLLGIGEALLAADFLPINEREEEREAFIKAVRASIGAVRVMRRNLSTLRAGAGQAAQDSSVFADLPPAAREKAKRMQGTRLREYRFSDSIFLGCPLKPEDGHFPARGVYELVSLCSDSMLVQLAVKRPVRVGIDIGIGAEDDGELFSAALVRAHRLEAKVAQYPRVVAGDGLVNYLHASTNAAAGLDGDYERNLAKRLLQLIVKDNDQQWIVDYAGPMAREELLRGEAALQMMAAARQFALRSREDFKPRTDDLGRELFGRYSKLVQYLDKNSHLWPDPKVSPL